MVETLHNLSNTIREAILYEVVTDETKEVERVKAQEVVAALGFLADLMPEYMAAYRATGLLPESGFHHAVHVNDRIVPAVHRGEVRVRPAFDRFLPDGTAVFQTTSFEGEKATGYAGPDSMPDPFGPRNCGQSAAAVMLTA